MGFDTLSHLTAYDGAHSKLHARFGRAVSPRQNDAVMGGCRCTGQSGNSA
jgi:hypothetical protein